jgi:hypothetical protein
MMFKATAEQIANSHLSGVLQNTLWVVPASQSTHIVALSVLFASMLMISLRILGVGIAGRSVSQLAGTLLPWMWRALLVLFLTGVLQTIVEPVRQFITPIFWLKMLLVAVLALLTLWFSHALRANVAAWDSAATRPATAKLFAVVSIIGWATVIVFGRFIGYVWAIYL